MTVAENNIRALEMIVEDLRNEFNAAIDEYELSLEYPELYDVELTKSEMDNAQRFYEEAKEDLEREIAWLEFDAR